MGTGIESVAGVHARVNRMELLSGSGRQMDQTDHSGIVHQLKNTG
ncbi:hypothetical protein ABID49_000750 [Bhargavaea ullalensis]|uniref:Uncharacterized protein n=1 Tax=Bhargavaea ullalensis TaxID=1265685 RepID=A0ABV2G9A7_9BACL